MALSDKFYGVTDLRVLITGGCGFVGSSLARMWKEAQPSADIVVFDNLRRRGGELNLEEFKRLGITFVHGDVRHSDDLESVPGQFDVMIEASAEPSVHAGTDGSTSYLLDTNLGGTIKCLEFARRRTRGMIFLSTSRVYPIPPLRELSLREEATRFEYASSANSVGISSKGISEDFPVVGRGFRSLYGTTKLASELICEEYVANFKLPIVINRCGVIAGRGQFGKTDQGVFTLWAARHKFGGKLSYTGFGGKGKQVRDLLHPSDLFNLIQSQLIRLESLAGKVYSVGGGRAGSVSLQEFTKICAERAGRSIVIESQLETAAVDLPWIIMDASRAQNELGWAPQMTPDLIAKDIIDWLAEGESKLRPLFS
jgi:CDP-paratose 2-epimerase